MSLDSLNRIFTINLRQLFIASLIGSLLIFASVQPVSAATVSIVDSLGAATPATQFSVFGSAGTTIAPSQFVGAKFTLTQPTTLTEIGGFINNCAIIILGVPMCPNTLPFLVQIRPSMNGVPDPSMVLASFVLSHDNNPLVISFESVDINLPLAPGTYFALFAPQGSDLGFLLGSATDPFNYQAGLIDIGVLNPLTAISSVNLLFSAVRILGETNVLIEGCDSGVPDVVLPSGSTLSQFILECAEDANNHGQFVSCVSHATDDAKKTGTITGQQKSAIQKCAAQADIP